MIREIVRVAAYRIRATFHERWAGYLALVVLVGLLGGVSMAAVAGARRTQSSFPTYLASTHPSDVQVFTEFDPISNTGFSAAVNHAVAHVHGVARVADVVGFDGTLQVLGHHAISAVPGEAPPTLEGSANGGYSSLDAVTLVRGRRADPRREDEVVMTAGAAAEFRLHLGSILPVAFFTDAQVAEPDFKGYPADRPAVIVPFKLVGIIEYEPQIVQNDDDALGDQLALTTPALTRRLERCCAYYSYAEVVFDRGQTPGRVERAIGRVVPDLGPSGGFQTDAPFVAKAERAIRPESIALAVFGALAALAALVICSQVVHRIVRRGAHEAPVVRALGAGPVMAMADGFAGATAAIAAGSVLAVGVALALSPLAPIGPVRPVYPDIGVAADWTVLSLGFVLFFVVLTVVAVVASFRDAPHRLVRTDIVTERASRWGRATTAMGLSPSAELGVRAALGSGTARGSAPVRSALLGAVLAVTVMVTTATFASSLDALVSQPSLYGWNWGYALLAGFSAAENLPAAETAALLHRDPDVAHWAGVYFTAVKLGNQTAVPVLALNPGAPVQPSMLTGHPVESPAQVVLGPATFTALHTHLGARIVVDIDGHRRPLRVVGTATLPTIGSSGQAALTMGTGAVMADSLFSATDRNQQGSPEAGPMAEFITVRPGVSQTAALASLDHIAAVLDQPSDPDAPAGGVVGALRPAEIADYREVGVTPALFAAILAAGALVGLGLTLIASVRQRRRQFAVLKALGCSQRQLARSVLWQASVAAVAGVVVGVPVGIALGRWLWTLFAEGISAVPHPTVPVLAISAVALGAVVFANLVALIPGRVAAGSRTSLLLRAE